MRYLLLALFLLPLLLVAQKPSQDLFSLAEGTSIVWQTTSTDFNSLMGELELSSTNMVSYKMTNNKFFYVNGSPVGGDNMTFEKNGKTVTIWMSTFKTRWTKCPHGDCEDFVGYYAGVTVGRLKT